MNYMNTKVSSLQLVIAVVIGVSIYHGVVYITTKMKDKVKKKQPIADINAICTKVFAEQLRNNLRTRGNQSDVYKCGTHDIYFVVHDNGLYGVKNVQALKDEGIMRNVKNVPNCSQLRQRYTYTANLV